MNGSNPLVFSAREILTRVHGQYLSSAEPPLQALVENSLPQGFRERGTLQSDSFGRDYIATFGGAGIKASAHFRALSSGEASPVLISLELSFIDSSKEETQRASILVRKGVDDTRRNEVTKSLLDRVRELHLSTAPDSAMSELISSLDPLIFEVSLRTPARRANATEILLAPLVPDSALGIRGAIVSPASEEEPDSQEATSPSFLQIPESFHSPLSKSLPRAQWLDEVFLLIQKHGPRVLTRLDSHLSVQEAEVLCQRLKGTGDKRFLMIAPYDFPHTPEVWQSISPRGLSYRTEAMVDRVRLLHDRYGKEETAPFSREGFQSIIGYLGNQLFAEANSFGTKLRTLQNSITRDEREDSHPLFEAIQKAPEFSEIRGIGFRSWDLPTVTGLTESAVEGKRGKKVVYRNGMTALVDELILVASQLGTTDPHSPRGFIDTIRTILSRAKAEESIRSPWGKDLLPVVIGAARAVRGNEDSSILLMDAIRFTVENPGSIFHRHQRILNEAWRELTVA